MVNFQMVQTNPGEQCAHALTARVASWGRVCTAMWTRLQMSPGSHEDGGSLPNLSRIQPVAPEPCAARQTRPAFPRCAQLRLAQSRSHSWPELHWARARDIPRAGGPSQFPIARLRFASSTVPPPPPRAPGHSRDHGSFSLGGDASSSPSESGETCSTPAAMSSGTPSPLARLRFTTVRTPLRW